MGPSPSPTRRRITARQILAGLLVVAALIFVAENTGRTTIRFIGPKTHTPLWLALGAAFLVGLVAGLLLAWRRRREEQEPR